jgi:hypothetical protein
MLGYWVKVAELMFSKHSKVKQCHVDGLSITTDVVRCRGLQKACVKASIKKATIE